MAIDFRQTPDRALATAARAQQIVRRALAAGTRHVRGADDSQGALHRAAAGPTLLTPTVYALTGLVPENAAHRAEIYVRLGADTFAVCLERAAAAAGSDDGPAWEASRIVKIDTNPAH